MRNIFTMRLIRLGSRTFTLLELLIVIGIIAILATITLVIFDRGEVFKKARDHQRITDLNRLNRALTVLSTEVANFDQGNVMTVYTSLPDATPTCDSWVPNLPALPSGWSYHCAPSGNLKQINGTGWLPVNFTQSQLLDLPELPVDPLAPRAYYTYVVGHSWELETSLIESTYYRTEVAPKDGGTDPVRYEVGTDLVLTPASIEAAPEVALPAP